MPNGDRDMHRTQLFLPRKIHQYLQHQAHEEGTTVSDVVRTILTDYFQKIYRKQTELGIQTLLKMGTEI